MKLLITTLMTVMLSLSYGKTITKSTASRNFINGIVEGQTVEPGDTVLWSIGSHTGYHFFGDMVGTKENHIYFDLNGQTIDANGQQYAIRFIRSNYIHIFNGTIREGLQNNFRADECTHVEFYNIESYECSGTSVRIEWQAQAAYDTTWRGAFIDPFVRIEDCIIDGAVFEGIYTGNSNMELTYYTSLGIPYYQPFTDTVIVRNCTVSNTDYDGIQIGSVIGWAEVSNNTVYGFAGSNNSIHGSGIQVGEATEGIVYNNKIYDPDFPAASGISCLGQGVLIFNNIIEGTDLGIFISDRFVEPNKTSMVFHNTVINAVTAAYDNRSRYQQHYVKNNIFHVASGGTAMPIIGNTPMLNENNITGTGATDLTNLNLVNLAGNDFRLQAGSTANNAGTPILDFDPRILKNYLGQLRNVNGFIDAGAY